MNKLLVIFLFVLPVTCFSQPNPAGDGAVLEIPDNLFCSGFEACPPFCGDGTQDPGEACDDGNQVDGDGCSANCLSDETCGNGITDYYPGETCDDGNTEDGDGCSATCALEGCYDQTYPGFGDSCSVGVGACQKAGALICNAAGTGLECSVTEGLPTMETCNDLDDDCDGQIDEDFPAVGESCSVGIGACQQPGTLVCDPQDSAGPPVCSATQGVPGSEVCNGIDDDCDGEIDESVPPEPCATQAGVCLGSTKLCGGGIGYIECSYGEYGPDYEVWELSCDGLDNDCDGTADADLPVNPCALQEGVCAGSVKTCAGIAGWLACGPEDYGLYYEPDEVSCDYKDNDCDGAVDEPFVDPGLGLYIDDENCGACNNSCTGRFPNATGYCEVQRQAVCSYICDENYYECDGNPVNGCETFGSCP